MNRGKIPKNLISRVLMIMPQIIYAGRYVPTVPYLIYAGRYVPTVPYLILINKVNGIFFNTNEIYTTSR